MSAGVSDLLVRAVASVPQGQTTAQIAARIGRKPASVASQLSKLFMYGRIDREFRRSDNGVPPQRWAVWRPK